MPLITLPEPKYPLTESEKKWLAEREKRGAYFCFHCSGGRLDFPCLDSWHLNNSCPVEDAQDYKDAAEFEARVVAKLAQSPCWSCPEKSKLSCPRGKSEANGRPKAEACRLKHARLAVEEEMP